MLVWFDPCHIHHCIPINRSTAHPTDTGRLVTAGHDTPAYAIAVALQDKRTTGNDGPAERRHRSMLHQASVTPGESDVATYYDMHATITYWHTYLVPAANNARYVQTPKQQDRSMLRVQQLQRRAGCTFETVGLQAFLQ